VAMVSKAFFIASNSSTDSPRPPGRMEAALSTARNSISLQPPPPGKQADANLDQSHVELGVRLGGRPRAARLRNRHEREFRRARSPLAWVKT